MNNEFIFDFNKMRTMNDVETRLSKFYKAISDTFNDQFKFSAIQNQYTAFVKFFNSDKLPQLKVIKPNSKLKSFAHQNNLYESTSWMLTIAYQTGGFQLLLSIVENDLGTKNISNPQIDVLFQPLYLGNTFRDFTEEPVKQIESNVKLVKSLK